MNQLACCTPCGVRSTKLSGSGTNAVELAAQHELVVVAQAAGGHLALAWVAYQRDDLVEASRYLDQAAAMAGAPGSR